MKHARCRGLQNLAVQLWTLAKCISGVGRSRMHTAFIQTSLGPGAQMFHWASSCCCWQLGQKSKILTEFWVSGLGAKANLLQDLSFLKTLVSKVYGLVPSKEEQGLGTPGLEGHHTWSLGDTPCRRSPRGRHVCEGQGEGKASSHTTHSSVKFVFYTGPLSCVKYISWEKKTFLRATPGEHFPLLRGIYAEAAGKIPVVSPTPQTEEVLGLRRNRTTQREQAFCPRPSQTAWQLWLASLPHPLRSCQEPTGSLWRGWVQYKGPSYDVKVLGSNPGLATYSLLCLIFFM